MDYLQDRGIVRSVKDSVVVVEGLKNVKLGEMVVITSTYLVGSQQTDGVIKGFVLNLEENLVKLLAFSSDRDIKVGMFVFPTGKVIGLEIDLPALLGRVINPLGEFLDGNVERSWDVSKFPTAPFRHVDVKAAGIMRRRKVIEPLSTGIKMIDILVPIGRGQRELIIGDKKTGKTTLAIDTILNQKGTGVICVYVAIGKRLSEIARLIRILKRNDAMQHTVMVVSSASDPASLQYIAPYSGCAIAEEYMRFGIPAVVIYDDLTRHADVYRQISLLLRRPVGREAYPGDVFYLHSRLLERAGRIQSGFGLTASVTALPIVETLQGDVSAYIPTNIISITDGQIFLDGVRHQEGLRPAVDPGISVSRIGSSAQPRLMKTLAGSLKLKLAQFREVEGFAKFGSDLDAVTKKILADGLRLTEMLKQPKNKPVFIYKQVVLLFAATYGFLDAIDASEMNRYELSLHKFLDEHLIFKPYKNIMETSDIIGITSDINAGSIQVRDYFYTKFNLSLMLDPFAHFIMNGFWSLYRNSELRRSGILHEKSFDSVFRFNKLLANSRFGSFAVNRVQSSCAGLNFSLVYQGFFSRILSSVSIAFNTAGLISNLMMYFREFGRKSNYWSLYSMFLLFGQVPVLPGLHVTIVRSVLPLILRFFSSPLVR